MKKICKLMLLLFSVLFLTCNPDGAEDVKLKNNTLNN